MQMQNFLLSMLILFSVMYVNLLYKVTAFNSSSMYLQLSYKMPATFAVSVDYVAKAVVVSVSVDVSIWVLAVVFVYEQLAFHCRGVIEFKFECCRFHQFSHIRICWM